jgi:hypothetical protein
MAGMLDEEDADLLEQLVAVCRFTDEASRARYAAQRGWNAAVLDDRAAGGAHRALHR